MAGNRIFAFGLMVFAFTFSSALAEENKDWNEEISSDQGKFAVSVKPTEKKVEVKKVEGISSAAPPHMRMRILRENDRPLELRLRTIDRVDSPLLYTGQLKQWNDSYMGIEFDFSFDKKTWKRLGKVLKKAVP